MRQKPKQLERRSIVSSAKTEPNSSPQAKGSSQHKLWVLSLEHSTEPARPQPMTSRIWTFLMRLALSVLTSTSVRLRLRLATLSWRKSLLLRLVRLAPTTPTGYSAVLSQEPIYSLRQVRHLWEPTSSPGQWQSRFRLAQESTYTLCKSEHRQRESTALSIFNDNHGQLESLDKVNYEKGTIIDFLTSVEKKVQARRVPSAAAKSGEAPSQAVPPSQTEETKDHRDGIGHGTPQ